MILKKRSVFLFLFLCWFLIQAILLIKNGIFTDGEAVKYISEADYFYTHGTLSSPNFWLYSTQIFLILLFKTLHSGYAPIVIIQLLFNLWATFSIYRFTRDTFSKRAGIFCTIIFLLNYPLQEFNTYLQTESLFYSITIIFSIYLLRLTGLTIKNFIIIFFSLIIISITRTTGILFVPPAFLYLFFHFFRSIRLSYKLLAVSVVTVVFLFFLNLAIGSGGEFDFMLPFRDERIICGVPTLSEFVNIKTAANSNSLYGIFYYIVHNFGQFINLTIRKSMAFWGLLRSYYSTWHNIYLGLFFSPVYIMIIAGIRYWIKKAPHTLLYFSAVILLTWGTVILTCDDWHNRFYMTVSPYLLILGIPSVQKFFSKLRPDERNTDPE